MKTKLWIGGLLLAAMIVGAWAYTRSDTLPGSTVEAAPTPTNAVPAGREVKPIATATPEPTPDVSVTPTPALTPNIGELTRRTEEIAFADDSAHIGITYLAAGDQSYTEFLTENEANKRTYSIPGLCESAIIKFGEETVFSMSGIGDGYQFRSNGFFLSDKDGTIFVDIQPAEQQEFRITIASDGSFLLAQNGETIIAGLINSEKIRVEVEPKDTNTYICIVENYVNNDELEDGFLLDTRDAVKYYNRQTQDVVWMLDRFYNDDTIYRLTVENTEEPDGEPIVLYQAQYGFLPDIFNNADDASADIMEKLAPGEAKAKKPHDEWETAVSTTKLAETKFGTLYVDTEFCGYRFGEDILATVTERRLRVENPKLHLYFTDTVQDPECTIGRREVAAGAEEPGSESYSLYVNLTDEFRESKKAVGSDGTVLWTETVTKQEDGSAMEERTYSDRSRVRKTLDGKILEDATYDLGDPPKLLRSADHFYSGLRPDRVEVFDAEGHLVETLDYFYNAEGKQLLQSVRNTYDVNGNLIETVTYDENGKVMPPTEGPLSSATTPDRSASQT
ncbi:MAG: hypothetical protein IJM57_10480 [Lachnospiraceae bacterium]|nr:hypothetical protein [Lachnospiraceae bacterium]